MTYDLRPSITPRWGAMEYPHPLDRLTAWPIDQSTIFYPYIITHNAYESFMENKYFFGSPRVAAGPAPSSR